MPDDIATDITDIYRVMYDARILRYYCLAKMAWRMCRKAEPQVTFDAETS